MLHAKVLKYLGETSQMLPFNADGLTWPSAELLRIATEVLLLVLAARYLLSKGPGPPSQTPVTTASREKEKLLQQHQQQQQQQQQLQQQQQQQQQQQNKKKNVIVSIYASLQKLGKTRQSSSTLLSQKETDELVSEWTPEPLVPPLMLHGGEAKCAESATVPEFTGRLHDVTTKVDEKAEEEATEKHRVYVKSSVDDTKVLRLIDLATWDSAGASKNTRIRDAALEVVDIYGVGACGPPGFYGFALPHVHLENHIAEFLGTEAAVLYSQGFAAVSSAVPAFCKRSDIVLLDDAACFALQRGALMSRAHVTIYKHADMEDLEKKLQLLLGGEKDRGEATRSEKRVSKIKKAKRNAWVLTEGLFEKTGTIAPFSGLIKLKRRYQFQLVVDDSLAVGVLGKTGRGSPEHHGLNARDIDVLLGSLAHTLGGTGGYCAGTREIIAHQRLGSSAYCFSAAMPAMMAAAGSKAIELVSRNTRRRAAQIANTRTLREAAAVASERVVLASPPGSPLQHICVNLTKRQQKDIIIKVAAAAAASGGQKTCLCVNCEACVAARRDALHASAPASNAALQQEAIVLQEIVAYARESCGLLLTRAKIHAEHELSVPRPSIRIMVPAYLDAPQMAEAASRLRRALAHVLERADE